MVTSQNEILNNDANTSLITPLETSSEKDQYRPMPRSHLRKTIERQSKKTLFLTGLALIILTIFLFVYGQTILVNFSILLGYAKNNSTTNNTQDSDNVVYITPPILDSHTEATNSATLRITGIEATDLDTKIRLYVNDELVDVTKPQNDNSFIFENVTLKEGTNSIKAVAIVNDKTSNTSNILNIKYLKSAPSLNIDYPSDGITFSGQNSTLVVKGKTDSGNSVTVNDYTAITKTDGHFSYNFRMQNGENKIKVVAQDQAGNKTEKEIRVNYAP